MSSSGLGYTRTSETNYGGNTSTGSQVISDGTLLYTSSGQIWDPSTMTEVGTFPVTTYNAASYPDYRSIALDTSFGEIYSIGEEQIGSGDATVVSAYGMKSHALQGTLVFSQLTWPTVSDLIRWGTDGLAFIAPGAGQSGQELYLVRSSVVSPSAPNPTPALATIAPASVNAEGPGFMLTVNGSNFIASSVIDWNGTAVTTTVVSGQQLTAAVPASAIAQAGTAQIAVYTPGPGGGSSPSAILAINAPAPAVTLSPSSLSFESTTQSVASTPETVVLTNSGSATLTISRITATEDFSETNTCGSSVAPAATCNIAVIFTPSTTGARTGTLTISDSASDSPQPVTLSGTGVAAITIGAPQPGATSASVNSGGTATYNLALAGGSGFSGTVNLSCSGAPQYSTCYIAPSSVNLASGNAGNFTVTVTTTTTQAALRGSAQNWTLAGLYFAPFFGLGWLLRRKQRLSVICSVGLAVALVFGMSGCSGSGGGGTSPPTTYRTRSGTYTLTVTATSGEITTTQHLNLVVN